MEINFLQNYPIISFTVDLILIITGINLLILLFYVYKGKTLADRAIAVDAISIQAIAVILLYSMRHGSTLYISAILVIAVLGFLALVVVSKYIIRGNIVYPLKKGHPGAEAIKKRKDKESDEKEENPKDIWDERSH